MRALKRKQNMARRKLPSINKGTVLNSFKKFLDKVKEAQNILCLTGAGVSAESGLPVYSGIAGSWRIFKIKDLATPQAWNQNPGIVWEYYHYRRDIAFKAQPNNAHKALAIFEKSCIEDGKKFNLITQNIDGLHGRAGSERVIELHGSVEKVQCTKCKEITVDKAHPICPALQGKGNPNIDMNNAIVIELENLPKCKKCQGVLRPYIVWFGEDLHEGVGDKCKALVDACNLLMVIGSSNIVYPGALFAPMVFQKGGIVAEFNINPQPKDYAYEFYFQGPCGSTVPRALGVEK